MKDERQQQLGKTLWSVAVQLRGTMHADRFRDYMLAFLFLAYLSNRYQKTAKEKLQKEYCYDAKQSHFLPEWYQKNPDKQRDFEQIMHAELHYIIPPHYLWQHIVLLAQRLDNKLLHVLESSFLYIEKTAFEGALKGVFSELNLRSDKLGKNYEERNRQLCQIVNKISAGLIEFSREEDILGDAYEYLIAQFAADSNKKAGEFYTPQQISTVLSKIVLLDTQDPTQDKKRELHKILDFACGSGSLLLNLYHHLSRQQSVSQLELYGQESNITTCNLARMNMVLHGVKYDKFEIYHGNTLKNDWPILQETSSLKKASFDTIVANPPFSLRWEAKAEYRHDPRFKDYAIAPKSAADFAFLLHGLSFLKEDGVMAILLPHGVLFRGAAEAAIRKKLLHKNYIDAVIALPCRLFYATTIPLCILVIKKCKHSDDLLFINASQHFEKKKRQNCLRPQDIEKIVATYRFRKEEKYYSRRVLLSEIAEKHDYNLNVSFYVNTVKPETAIDLQEVNRTLQKLEQEIDSALKEHNAFLRELGLPELPKG